MYSVGCSSSGPFVAPLSRDELVETTDRPPESVHLHLTSLNSPRNDILLLHLMSRSSLYLLAWLDGRTIKTGRR